MRSTLAAWLATPAVRNGIQLVILVNAIALGMQTSTFVTDRIGGFLGILDDLCLAIFVIEIALKIVAHGFGFFRGGWNLFDLAVVGVSLSPSGAGFSVLRALRVLRLLRVVSFASELRVVIEGLLRALPGIGSVFLLLGLIYYVGAVLTTQLYGAEFAELFGTLGNSAFTLFTVMTLEGWPDVARTVMEAYPNSWLFFVIFIMATNFAVLNLVVGLIVNSMESAHSEGQQEKTDAYQDETIAALREIRERLAAMERARD